MDILDEFDSILEVIACNDPGNSMRAHKLREPIRKALAERDAALVALRSCAEWMYDPDNSVDCFERIGELYRRETGYLRPGKDSVNENSSSEENIKRFGGWCEGQQRKRLAIVRAALSATGET